MAPASARPSKVEVPRPISSISTSECSVAPCTMAAASVISSMKVDCALARSSAAPMRVWMASIGPSRQARGRHERAHGGEQHDQRHLAHERALAAHVRAGDHQHAPARVEPAVVGHEAAAARSRPAAPPPPGGGRRSMSMQGSRTKLGRHQSSVLARSASAASASSAASARASAVKGVEVRLQLVEQLVVEQLLAGEGAVLRRQRLVLEGLELGRDEALGVLQRLAALVVGRHLVQPGRCVTSM